MQLPEDLTDQDQQEYFCSDLKDMHLEVRAHLLHKARVDVVYQVVDLLELLFVPVREGELSIRIPALHNCAGVDAVLPQRIRDVEFPKHLQ